MMLADTEKSLFGKNVCHASNTVDFPVVNINIIKISSITADFKQIPTKLKIKILNFFQGCSQYPDSRRLGRFKKYGVCNQIKIYSTVNNKS